MQKLKSLPQTYLWGTLSLVFFLLIYFSWQGMNRSRRLWISKVVISGAPAAEEATLESALQSYLQQNILHLNLHKLQKTLLSYAWVADTQLQRVWPNTLMVTIYPQQLLAQWNNSDAINAYGELFPLQVKRTLSPQLYGPDGQAVKIFAMYQQIALLVAPLSLQVSSLRLNETGDWSLTLSNQLKIQLGAQDILTRLQRFVKVYVKVFPNNQAASGRTVDLRYPNGMAVSRRGH